MPVLPIAIKNIIIAKRNGEIIATLNPSDFHQISTNYNDAPIPSNSGILLLRKMTTTSTYDGTYAFTVINRASSNQVIDIKKRDAMARFTVNEPNSTNVFLIRIMTNETLFAQTFIDCQQGNYNSRDEFYTQNFANFSNFFY